MKSLISINSKFMVLTPKELVETIITSKYTNGVEAYIDTISDFQNKYLEDLVFELKKHELILQIHGNVELEYDKQLEYVKRLEKYSDYLGYPIVFTLHTVYDDDKDISLAKTAEYIGNLIEDIDNDKIIVSLENLNDDRGLFRLDKNAITSTILNNDRLFFTYDIGHEIANYGDIINVDSYLINELRNVHIHSSEKGLDHKPIYKNDIHYNEIMKGLIFLINNNYQYNIVYEYALEYCRGETTKERIIDYLDSIDFVAEKYN